MRSVPWWASCLLEISESTWLLFLGVTSIGLARHPSTKWLTEYGKTKSTSDCKFNSFLDNFWTWKRSIWIWFYTTGIFTHILLWSYFPQNGGREAVKWALLTHMMRRLIECIAWESRSQSTVNLPQAIHGLTYYPLLSVALHLSSPTLPSATIYSWGPLNLTGSIVMLGMVVVQGNIHQVLYNLKKLNSRSGYSVPKGGLFELVAAPHYFVEFIFWMVGAILCGSLTWHANLCWYILGMGHTASETNTLYHSLEARPNLSRRAFIPFLY